jgi:hypothetical protein
MESAALGIIGFMNAALGVRLTRAFFAGFFFAVAFFGAAFFVVPFFVAFFVVFFFVAILMFPF